MKEVYLYYLHYPLSLHTIIFINSTIVSPQVKQQGGNTAPPINRNWIKDLLDMAPPMRTRPSFPLSQSPHQETSISLLSLSISEAVIATAEYGKELTAAVAYRNVYGCQFHPEKSGPVGLAILKAFLETREGEPW